MLLATDYLLLTTCYLLLATCYLLLTTCSLLLYYLLLTTYCLLFTIYFWLLTTCYLLLVIPTGEGWSGFGLAWLGLARFRSTGQGWARLARVGLACTGLGWPTHTGLGLLSALSLPGPLPLPQLVIAFFQLLVHASQSPYRRAILGAAASAAFKVSVTPSASFTHLLTSTCPPPTDDTDALPSSPRNLHPSGRAGPSF